jgi:hypothetical protein
METTHHVDLRGPLPKGLFSTGTDFLESKEIAPLLARVTAKGAKTAVVGADVGIIDMPVYVIVNATAVSPAVGKLRQFTDLEEVDRFEEEKGLGITEPVTCPDLCSNGSKRNHRFT